MRLPTEQELEEHQALFLQAQPKPPPVAPPVASTSVLPPPVASTSALTPAPSTSSVLPLPSRSISGQPSQLSVIFVADPTRDTTEENARTWLLSYYCYEGLTQLELDWLKGAFPKSVFGEGSEVCMQEFVSAIIGFGTLGG